MSIRFECLACGKRLSAPDGASGKKAKCPGCQVSMTVPEPDTGVLEAEEFGGGELADEDWESPAEDSPSGRGADADEMVCPMCQELVKKSARKCRYCGEVLSGGRPGERKRGRQQTADSNLETVDWVLCLLCSGIGCIVSIIYLIQGKPKGLKMLGISIAMAVFWNIVQIFVTVALQQGR